MTLRFYEFVVHQGLDNYDLKENWKMSIHVALNYCIRQRPFYCVLSEYFITSTRFSRYNTLVQVSSFPCQHSTGVSCSICSEMV